LRHLREIFYTLQLACGGSLTQIALAQVAAGQPQALAALAAELDRRFVALDADGSGSLEWSEIVAAVLGSAGDSALRGCGVAPAGGEACHRAFDLLSEGALAISPGSLAHLFGGARPEGDTIGSFGRQRAALGEEHFERMLFEVECAGHIDALAFLELARG